MEKIPPKHHGKHCGPEGPLPPHPHHGHGPGFDRCAPECDDQLAVFSKVGRGLKGDGFKVRIASDDDQGTYLEGLEYDSASGTWSSEWMTENLNGGQLSYQYNLRPWTVPQTFTITFRYARPGREEWAWTTPAIPYLWDDDGSEESDGIVGGGVADIFVKKTTEQNWNYPTINESEWPDHPTSSEHGKLIYPDGWERESLNAPAPGDPWSVNLEYGIGGDIDAPNIDDLAKIIGITPERIEDLADRSLPIPAESIPENMNVKEYIDSKLGDVLGDLAKIIGIDPENLEDLVSPDDDGERFYGYPNLMSLVTALMGDLLDKIFNQSSQNISFDPNTNTVSITWNAPLDTVTGGKIAAGDLNVFSGTSNPTASQYNDALRTRPSITSHDITFQ